MSSAPAETATSHIWNGIFPSWSAACDAAIHGGGAFESDRWLERITQQLQDYRNALKKHGLVALPPRPSNLPWIASLTRARSITDFGGSSGWCYDYLQNTAAGSSVASYVIVEIERIVAHMKATGLQRHPVVYKTAQEPLDSCDVLYCNSVLQYFGSNAELLSLMQRNSPEHILLDDLLGKGDDDFFTTQAYYGAAIPHRFVGLGRLVSDVTAAGYELLVSAPFPSTHLGIHQPLPMENFPVSFRVRHGVSLLFRRVKGR